MSRLLVAAGLLLWLGATLLLSGSRRISRPSLSARLGPFSPGASSALLRRRHGADGAGSPRAVVGSLAAAGGNRLAGLLGVEESLGLRLRRIHSPLDVAGFRTRQLGWTAAALVAGLAVAALGAPLPLAVLSVVGAPLLAFLLVEQRLSRRSVTWQERVAMEIPVVAEQLGMLLNAGFSLGAALNRLAARGDGCCARDLGLVANRIRQGVAEADALREWAEVARVDAVDRLVRVLALESEAGDLGRLVGAEARQARRDLHRRTTELIERRAQQVWVPVSVATLVPGVILLAVPFLAALHMFANA